MQHFVIELTIADVHVLSVFYDLGYQCRLFDVHATGCDWPDLPPSCTFNSFTDIYNYFITHTAQMKYKGYFDVHCLLAHSISSLELVQNQFKLLPKGIRFVNYRNSVYEVIISDQFAYGIAIRPIDTAKVINNNNIYSIDFRAMFFLPLL